MRKCCVYACVSAACVRVCVCEWERVWRALCGCPANASTNCIRAPPSTATATPTPTTRRRLSLPVAAACITRSFPPVGRTRLSARYRRSFACDFAFFGKFPLTTLSFASVFFIHLSLFYSRPTVVERVRVGRVCAFSRLFSSPTLTIPSTCTKVYTGYTSSVVDRARHSYSRPSIILSVLVAQ